MVARKATTPTAYEEARRARILANRAQLQQVVGVIPKTLRPAEPAPSKMGETRKRRGAKSGGVTAGSGAVGLRGRSGGKAKPKRVRKAAAAEEVRRSRRSTAQATKDRLHRTAVDEDDLASGSDEDSYESDVEFEHGREWEASESEEEEGLVTSSDESESEGLDELAGNRRKSPRGGGRQGGRERESESAAAPPSTFTRVSRPPPKARAPSTKKQKQQHQKQKVKVVVLSEGERRELFDLISCSSGFVTIQHLLVLSRELSMEYGADHDEAAVMIEAALDGTNASRVNFDTFSAVIDKVF